MIKRLLLSLILLVAGIAHIIRPEIFDPAIPFSFKLEINYLSGVLEILLGIGLWIPSTRDRAAQWTALWFMALIPVHIYMAIKVVPIFGASHPAIHWIRTLFQFPLIFWALSLQDKGWLISQRWSDVLFVHFEVDAQKLQNLVPYPIDLYQGSAVVSVVPFKMGRIRFPFLPAIPGLSSLYELNLRTYVKVQGKPVVYFLTLDSNHLPGVLIARTFFSLPYRWKKLKLQHDSTYKVSGSGLELEAKILEGNSKSDFDIWSTERYALATKRFGNDMLGVVEHKPWSLKKAELIKFEDQFSPEFIEIKRFLGVSYASELDVRFRPFTRI